MNTDRSIHRLCWAAVAGPLLSTGMFHPPVEAATNTVTAATEAITHQRVESDTTRREQWQLTQEEWTRYQSLMQGIRGSVSPSTLSPLEVLGIHARSGEERRRYAERWAIAMREDAERILAFQHAYDAAQRRLFGETPLIDHAVLDARRARAESESIKKDDRLLFFTRSNCRHCNTVFERLLAKLSTFEGLDVYLTDLTTGQEEALRHWARERGITPEQVRSARVTLNFDEGLLRNTTASGQAAWPRILRRRGDTLSPLPPEQW